jgi:hypothetical protein
MSLEICKIYDHIFIINEYEELFCEKCNRTYMDYMEDIEIYLKEYR